MTPDERRERQRSEALKEARRAWHHIRRARGLCHRCQQPNPRWPKWACGPCQQRHTAWKANRQASEASL